MGWSNKKEKTEKEDGGLGEAKKSLFGRHRAEKSPAPPPAKPVNPYAVGPASSTDSYARQNNNPYATHNGANDPYAPRSQSTLSQAPTSSLGSLTLGSEQGGAPPSYRASPAPIGREKSPVPLGGYGGGASRYQSQGSYGQANGYGNSDPYGSGSGQQQSRHGASGYGGFGGRRGSEETITTDAGRQALFGDAPSRAQQTTHQQDPAAAQQGSDPSYANAGGYNSNGYNGYGEDRELTAEEQEEQEVEGTKDQIREMKRGDVATTRNALNIAASIEQTGRETLARLGQQGDRLHNAEQHLDHSSFQNKAAEQKAKELKTLNRSMWAVHVANPFTSDKKLEQKVEGARVAREHERNTLSATREAAYSSQQRQDQAAKDIRGMPTQPTKSRNLADRAKYQFEADSDDDQMENEIEDNLETLHKSAKFINKLGQAMGNELTSQNAHLDRISGKTDKVDDQIAMNRARLDRIK